MFEYFKVYPFHIPANDGAEEPSAKSNASSFQPPPTTEGFYMPQPMYTPPTLNHPPSLNLKKL